jgi:Ras-related protein Rab-1A
MFTENFMPTIGVDFKIRTIDVDGKTIKLQIWDTAGQERFKTITSSYYKGAHGIIVTYDITDRESFTAVQTWMGEVEKHAQDNISRILVGNKCDLEDQRAVSVEEGQELAEHFNVRFLETSAKDSKNVEQAFTLMTREIKNRVAVSQPKKQTDNPQNGAAKLSGAKTVPQKKKGCC